MRFVDEVVIKVRSGSGGAGALSFRREPYVPKGGPDGGNGGRGGDVVIRASAGLNTLEHLAGRGVFRAEDGSSGSGNRRSGRAGKDEIIEVPAGTLIYETLPATGKEIEGQRLLADLAVEGESLVVARGGRGGRGNAVFATSRNRAPRRADPGELGESKALRVELKLLADVGLVGRPNAGKSTLLSALTRAHPKAASYPFTTLSPALGVLQVGGYRRVVIADIPGLAEGAAEGRGLGHAFLKHIERTRLLVLLIECTEPDYMAACEGLLSELAGYGKSLHRLPRLVVRSKCDLPEAAPRRDEFPFDLDISSISGEGLEQLISMLADNLLSISQLQDQLEEWETRE